MRQEANGLYTLLSHSLPRMGRVSGWPVFRSICGWLRYTWANVDLPVRTRLHGFNVLVNPGNMYCFIIHDYPQFNAPLVQLVHEMGKAKKRPLVFADVGAGIGDTVLLPKERCPDAVEQFFCLEGDDTFFSLLRENMEQFNDVTLIKTMLARKAMRVRSLVKHHPGTAAAIGDDWVSAVPLDSVALAATATIDILKVDVDGFDGEVLVGATETIRRCRPAIIFEWHPKLILATRSDPFCGFETLADSGYSRFLWFNNIGTFSHFTGVSNRETLQKMTDLLLAVNYRQDEHFDVIALQAGSEINEIELAAMNYARTWGKGK
jgi:FkbM family methyltransferase